MAVIAGVCCCNMGNILTWCGGAIMASRATACDTTVIENRTIPTRGGMTIITCVAAGDMGWAFTCCGGAVMATRTTSQDIGMIDTGYRNPAGTPMTILTN